MPRVPTYDGARVSVSPAPTANLNATGPADAFGGNLGRDLRAGMEIYLSARKEADVARVFESITELHRAADDLLYGDKGLLATRTRAQAVGAAKQWAGDFEKIEGTIRDRLTPEQQVMFQKQAETTRSAYYKKAQRHEFEQTAAWRNDVYTAGIRQVADTVKRNYDDPQIVGMQIGRALEALRQRPEYLAANGPDGAVIRAQMEVEVEGDLHSQVVQSALNAGNTALAGQWLKDNEDRIPQKQLEALRQRLKPASDFAAGKLLASEAMTRIDSGVGAEKVERWMIEKAETREALSVAQSMMREQQDAKRRAADEQVGVFIEAFEKSPVRATMNRMSGDPAFHALPADTRARLLKYMRSEIEQGDRNARERFDSPEHLAAMLEVRENPMFAQMTRPEIIALTPKIGRTYVATLLSEHSRINTEAGRFKINPDLINDAMPKSALGSTPASREMAAAYRGAVYKALMDWKAKNPGKVPSDEEQIAIARAGNAEYVRIGKLMNSNVRAYEAREGDIPKEFFDRMSAKGATEKEIAAAWAIRSGGR